MLRISAQTNTNNILNKINLPQSMTFPAPTSFLQNFDTGTNLHAFFPSKPVFSGREKEK